MKKNSIKSLIANNVAKFQHEGHSHKNTVVRKIKKYVYTEKDLGEGLLYVGLSATAGYNGK